MLYRSSCASPFLNCNTRSEDTEGSSLRFGIPTEAGLVLMRLTIVGSLSAALPVVVPTGPLFVVLPSQERHQSFTRMRDMPPKQYAS